jgi:hypothetical protein
MPEQIVNAPYLALNGLAVSNNATTPNTKLTVAAGICRDSLNIYDLNLGNYLGANPNLSANTTTVIDTAIVGLNGLDTGVLLASKVYYIYVISDPQGYNPSGCIISLSSVPALPLGYGIYRLIGYWTTDASVHFFKGYYSGNNTGKTFWYDAVQPTAVVTGNATVYTAVDLSALVPAVDNIPVRFSLGLTPSAGGDTASFRPTGGTGDSYILSGQVSAIKLNANVKLLAKLSSGKAEIDYKVSSAGDSLAISVLGYDI